MTNVNPPGCCSDYLEHPNPQRRNKESVEIAFVFEHRFAFFYWIKCKQKLQRDSTTNRRIRDDRFHPPDLITWDWHDDCGGECDYIENELKRLNQRDEQEVALFCWSGLRSLNDGHIAPALWLNAIGNVYILQKQRDDDECRDLSCEYRDRYGRVHNIEYFRSQSDLYRSLSSTNTTAGVIWDLDMDYFTKGDPVDDRQYTRPMSKQAIERLLIPDNPLIGQILRNLKAITIALEPGYTGGLSQSLDLYKAWEGALFENRVFEKRCRWKRDLAAMNQ